MQGIADISTYTFQLPFTGMMVTVNPVTIVTTWAIIAVILVLAKLSVYKLSMVPTKRQAAVEAIVGWFEETITDSMGAGGRAFVPFIVTLFLFVLFSNWASLIPNVKSPTSDLNTCFALGGLVLFVSHAYAIKKKGLGKYIKSYFEPVWFLFLPNVFSEISKVLSHSFRLFGNIFAGGILIVLIPALLVKLFSWWAVPLGIIVVPGLNAFFGVFVGAVQALVFTLLAVAYIGVLSN
ncbi:MAG: F0F1 ATP synthase subunit A [Candidatus Omnitrophica bacterium]|nr:F0F1 ATP synthase subunit A [Candidatus Omnitrophota bacterium]